MSAANFAKSLRSDFHLAAPRCCLREPPGLSPCLQARSEADGRGTAIRTASRTQRGEQLDPTHGRFLRGLGQGAVRTSMRWVCCCWLPCFHFLFLYGACDTACYIARILRCPVEKKPVPCLFCQQRRVENRRIKQSVWGNRVVGAFWQNSVVRYEGPAPPRQKTDVNFRRGIGCRCAFEKHVHDSGSKR